MDEHWTYPGIPVDALPDTGGTYGLKNLIAGTESYTNGLDQAAVLSGGSTPTTAALSAFAQNKGERKD